MEPGTDDIYNEETIRALNEALESKEFIGPFHDTASLMDALNGDISEEEEEWKPPA